MPFLLVDLQPLFLEASLTLQKQVTAMSNSFSHKALVEEPEKSVGETELPSKDRLEASQQDLEQQNVWPGGPRRKSVHIRSPYTSLLLRKRGSANASKESLCSMSGIVEDLESDTRLLRLNVGGTIFNTTRSCLCRYPTTLLGSLSPDSIHFNRRKREYFFDRNPAMFSSILDLYRTDELHLPKNYCGNAAVKELEFWLIPTIWVSACCWANIHEALNDQRLHEDLKAKVPSPGQHGPPEGWRWSVWHTLYDRGRWTTVNRVWNILITLLILTTVVLFIADSLTEVFPQQYFKEYLNGTSPHSDSLRPRRLFFIWLLDVTTLGVMVLEFLLKVAVCPDVKLFFHNHINTLYGLSLLACVAGHVAEAILERPENWKEESTLDAAYIFLRCFHFLRMIRFFELLDRNASLRVMWVATKRCHDELLQLLGVFTVLAVFFGALVFFFDINENQHKPCSGRRACSLLNSIYWAIITMTTVGYGDITPASPLGRVVGALCALSGVLVLAMPVAVLTDSFQQYHLRQQIRHEKRKRQEDYFHKLSINSVGVLCEELSV